MIVNTRILDNNKAIEFANGNSEDGDYAVRFEKDDFGDCQLTVNSLSDDKELSVPIADVQMDQLVDWLDDNEVKFPEGFKKRYGIVYEAYERRTDGYLDGDGEFHPTSEVAAEWIEKFSPIKNDVNSFEEARDWLDHFDLKAYNTAGRYRNPRIGYIYVSKGHFEGE